MLEYHPDSTPTVGRFLECDDFARCIVGPFGSGKSSGCVVEVPRRAYGQQPGPDGIRHSRFAVIRNTKQQLRDTTRKTFEQWLGPIGEWRENPTELRIRHGDIDCEVLFRALDEPKDVRNLLSLELTGAYVNELREISEEIWKGLTGRVGRYPRRADGGPTWHGIWADSNPWHSRHWAARLFYAHPEGYQLFRQPSGRGPSAENLDNLPHGYYERMAIGKDSEWIRVYIDGLDGAADQGSVFGRWVEQMLQQGRFGEFQHQPDNIFTCWDLGLADATAIWWWRIKHDGVEVLDWYENQGEDLEHYWDQLDRRMKPEKWVTQPDPQDPSAMIRENTGGLNFKYAKHFLPHDSKQKTLASGTSVLARFLARYPGQVVVGPNLSINDGVQAGRWLLEQPGTRFHRRCEKGLEVLSEYKFEWDDQAKCYSKNPLHDFASHTGSAWRYVANVAKATQLITKPQERKLRENTGVMVKPDGTLEGLTMEQFFRLRERRR